MKYSETPKDPTIPFRKNSKNSKKEIEITIAFKKIKVSVDRVEMCCVSLGPDVQSFVISF